jgi:hypothetical protein
VSASRFLARREWPVWAPLSRPFVSVRFMRVGLGVVSERRTDGEGDVQDRFSGTCAGHPELG